MVILALAASGVFAENPGVISSSGAYSMESTTRVAGTSSEFQSSGIYTIASQLDSGAEVPVELSSFAVE
jgi:hypothetical protein